MKLKKILDSAIVLAIDDELSSLILIEEYLTPVCKEVIAEQNIEKALLLAKQKQPDIILLDIRMREIDGYEVCKKLKADNTSSHIPVIFLSSLLTVQDKVKGFEAGGVDYICKPFEIEEVLARIENCLRLHQKINQKQPITFDEKSEKIKNYFLTVCEMKVLLLYAQGYQRNEITQQLFISENTVKTHLKNILRKLNVKNRTQAIEKSHEIGLIVR